MNARIALSLILLSLAATACGNKGPLIQAPAEMPIEAPVDVGPDPDADDTSEGEPLSDPDVEGVGDDEGPGAG